jgi:hypothetical protein
MRNWIVSGSSIDELDRESGPSERPPAGRGQHPTPAADDGRPLHLAYGGEAAGDDQHRAAIHDAVEGLLDEAVTLRVERTRRLAQRKDGHDGRERTHGQASHPLSAAKPHPALAELCALTLRQTLERLRHRRHSSRRPADFRYRRPGTAMADIVDHVSGAERKAVDGALEPPLDLGRIRDLKVDSF